MAPLSVLLALLLAHPGTSIISGTPSASSKSSPSDKADLHVGKDGQAQARRVGLVHGVGPISAEESRESKEGRSGEQKRGAPNGQLSAEASHLHGSVYTGHGYGGGFEGYGGHHSSGLGFYGGDGGYGDLGLGGLGHSGHGDSHEHHASVHHEDYEHHHHHHHLEHHDPHLHKALALKHLLVPLAGVALLGAAAAFVTNPILLQLGVISGKRRRRSVPLSPEEEQLAKQRMGDLQILEYFMAQQFPLAEARAQEKRLLASYLTCTGIVPAASNDTAATANSDCLERLSCEMHQPEGVASPLEKHVMKVVTGEIMTNEYIPDGVKKSVELAVQRGKRGEDCARAYRCQDLDEHE